MLNVPDVVVKIVVNLGAQQTAVSALYVVRLITWHRRVDLNLKRILLSHGKIQKREKRIETLSDSCPVQKTRSQSQSLQAELL